MMQTQNTQTSVNLRPGKGFFLAWLCVFLGVFNSGNALAQVWSLALPGPGNNSAMATLDVGLLKRTAVGSVFDMQVDSTATYEIRLDKSEVLGNGDRSWYGSTTETGLDYALVITAGNKTAHLILTSPSGIFQLFGTSSDGELYSGNFHRLEHVRDEVASTEFTSQPVSSDEGTLPTFSNDPPFVIMQTVSQDIAPVGSQLTFNLTFTNNGSKVLAGQYVDIFFVLENTTLNQLPAGCDILEDTDSMPVLSCDLGNFAVGGNKQLSYTVTTSEISHPVVWSTARVGESINGEFVEIARNDLFVEIFRDVTTDSDGDGISDYNESLIGTDPKVPNADRTAYIDVLVAYTADINDFYLGEVDTRINQLFNVTNKIFKDSGTDIVFRPVGSHQVSYQPAQDLLMDLRTVTSRNDPAFSELSRLRKLHGGDLVVLFRTGEVNGLCGLANLGGKGTEADLSASYHKDFAFSVINIDCLDDSVLAHEIGHNLGLVHSRIEDPDGGTLPYSAGFGVDTRFVSVMAFPDDFHVVNRLYRFSDPYRACGPFLCGEYGEVPEHGADAVSSLKLVKHQVANYYLSQEERIGTFDAVSIKDGPVAATMGVGAYSTDGAEFKSVFSETETINLRMKIKPFLLQVGRPFVPHLVVMSDKEHLYQVAESGELEAWDRDFGTLKSTQAPRILGDRELFDVANDIDLQSAGLLDKKVHVFVAYRMADTGELIYGTEPFSFRVNSTNL